MASSVLLAAVVAFFHAWQAAIVGRLHGCMAAMVCLQSCAATWLLAR
jgi:hypothetical protein